MFVPNKHHRPNILKKKPKVPCLNISTEKLTADVQNLVCTVTKDSIEDTVHKSNYASERSQDIENDETEEYEVVIDSKHNITLALTQHANDGAQGTSQSCNAQEEVLLQSNVPDSYNVEVSMVDTSNLYYVYSTAPENVTLCDGAQNINVQDVIDYNEHGNEHLLSSLSNIKYKCNVVNCGKKFRSEKKFYKHINSHVSGRVAKPTSFDCPATKNMGDTMRRPCGQSFQAKEDLLKHLNEDHTAEDAVHKCSKCGRLFFWSLGLTGHERGGCGRLTSLCCSWDGCGKVFRQPCRLREHMRAHTGDKPYRCPFPDCAWSFRSASKLRRHTTQHTGERRHACPTCHRRFTRREHLRDHAARRHPLTGTAEPHDNNTDEEDNADLAEETQTIEQETKPEEPSSALSNMSSEMEEKSAVESITSPVEWQSARTHCTWPLSREQENQATYEEADGAYVEMSENSKSNIYTVRSDLFLHGNVLSNEDSNMIVASEPAHDSQHVASGNGTGTELVTSQPMDTGLSLLDAHPTTDLMQEELLYTDVAIDESLFRVFYRTEELA